MKKSILVLTCLFLAIPCNARTIIIDANGTGDYPTIQDAINDANNGDEIVVADGVYTGNGNRDIHFFGKDITVKSENGPENCIIDCNGTYTENHRGFYFKNGEGQESVLDGFTITNAHVVVLCEGGAAIYCEGSSPTICNCIITANTAELHPISLCYCYGGAIYIGEGSSPMIYNCVISDNSAISYGLGGGICCNNSSIIMAHCLIVGNRAYGPYSDGGGVYSYSGGYLKLYSCTVSDNSASGRGGGICFFHLGSDWYMRIYNSIIWGNSPDQIYTGSTFIGMVGYSDIQGGWSGTGNIDEVPCFADTDQSDYHLQSQAGRWNPNSQNWVTDANTSPCIDAGVPSYDWTAELWPHGKRINMGAYGGTPQASMSLSDVGNIADLDNDDSVDYNDLKLFTEKWLNEEVLLKEDLDRNGFVDFIDFAIFAENWLWQ